MGKQTGGRGAAPTSGDDPYATAVGGALYALAHGDTAGFQRWSDQVTAGLGHDTGDDSDEEGAEAALLLFARLVEAVTRAWDRGWQPAEVVRQLGRTRGDLHSRMAVDAVAAEMRRYGGDRVDPRWGAQLAALGAAVWWTADSAYPREWALRERSLRAEWVECALEVLFELSRLPRIERLCPVPGERAPEPVPGAPLENGSGDESARRRMSARVRALLAKAEATEFPQESEAFTARAQELMARYSIDHAVLMGTGADGGPVSRRLPVDEPYEGAKALLLDAVAEANRCRAVWLSDVGMSAVVGHAEDVDGVELLFTSLLVQADTAMVKGEARQRAGGRGRTKTYRQSFLTSFAQRIGERLTAAAESARRQAADAAEVDLLPVLASRDAAVGRVAEEMFPETVRGRVRGAFDEAGWVSGRAAADRAPLAGRRAVGGQ